MKCSISKIVMRRKFEAIGTFTGDKVFIHMKDGSFFSAHIWCKPSLSMLRFMVLDCLRMAKECPYHVKSVWVRFGGVITQYSCEVPNE